MPIAAAVPAIISGGTSIIGGLLGSNASNASSQTLQDNAQQVAGLTQNAVGNANNTLGNIFKQQGDIYNSETSNLSPYLKAGAQGADSLAAAFAPGGSLTQKFQFDPSQVTNSPEYQFQLQQGTDAINKSAAAHGSLLSGGTLKGLTQYGQGLASTAYQQAYNNALNTFQTNRNNTFGGLTALTGIGQNATGQFNNAAQNYGADASNYGNMYSNNTLNGARIVGDALTGGANAKAAGQVGSTNAWNSALGGLSNAALSYYAQKMYGGQNPYASSSGTLDYGANAPSPDIGSFPGQVLPAPNVTMPSNSGYNYYTAG